MRSADLALLHGFAASPFTWRKVIEPLAARHRVVALSRPWGPLAESVDATVAGLDEAGLQHPVLVGHSAGAEVTLATAAAVPDRVAGLVLVAPVVGGGPPAFVGRLAGLPGWSSVASPLLRVSLRGMGPALRMAVSDRSVVTADLVDGYRRPLLVPGQAESLWRMTRLRSADRASTSLGHPYLVVVGRDDRWATTIGQPEHRVTLDRCGHLPQEEQPERLVEEILRFIDGLPSGP